MLYCYSVLKCCQRRPLQLLRDELKEVYRLLKHIECTEVDDLTRGITTEALVELDRIVRGVLFPQQVLVKEIAVLRPSR